MHTYTRPLPWWKFGEGRNPFPDFSRGKRAAVYFDFSRMQDRCFSFFSLSSKQEHPTKLSGEKSVQKALSPVQTSNFRCAESNANEQNLLFLLISIRFGTYKVWRLNRALIIFKIHN